MKTSALVLVAAVTVLSASSRAAAQMATPVATQTVSADLMLVSGIAPVPPGASIVVETLDPVTIRGVECARAQSVSSDDAGAGSSRFSLTVDRDCVQRASGDLRVCWGTGECHGVEFEPGQSVDLGRITLKTPVASPPNVGAGPAESRRGSRSEGFLLAVSATAAAALSMFATAAIIWRRHPAG